MEDFNTTGIQFSKEFILWFNEYIERMVETLSDGNIELYQLLYRSYLKNLDSLMFLNWHSNVPTIDWFCYTIAENWFDKPFELKTEELADLILSRELEMMDILDSHEDVSNNYAKLLADAIIPLLPNNTTLSISQFQLLSNLFIGCNIVTGIWCTYGILKGFLHYTNRSIILSVEDSISLNVVLNQMSRSFSENFIFVNTNNKSFYSYILTFLIVYQQIDPIAFACFGISEPLKDGPVMVPFGAINNITTIQKSSSDFM